ADRDLASRRANDVNHLGPRLAQHLTDVIGDALTIGNAEESDAAAGELEEVCHVVDLVVVKSCRSSSLTPMGKIDSPQRHDEHDEGNAKSFVVSVVPSWFSSSGPAYTRTPAGKQPCRRP